MPYSFWRFEKNCHCQLSVWMEFMCPNSYLLQGFRSQFAAGINYNRLTSHLETTLELIFQIVRRHLTTINSLTPVLPKHPGTLNDSRYNRSSTKAGVLVAITDHGPIPLVGDITGRGNTTSALLHSKEKRQAAYSSGGFSSTYSWCQWESRHMSRITSKFAPHSP
ncbi:hypothetical protein AVEN_174041-1 [Araneus ventricosus]|uniref:Uncharacterized protein n=1 Tax=Araneus ventricosus TaxID=182803 RepID=A0A4Y2C1M5_ARAVE|nr:hypothetical protein AVEN_174041-1 [Araneus ventricosus]